MSNKFVWIKSPQKPWIERKELITTSLESGIDHVLDLNDGDKIHKLGDIKIISNNDDGDIYLTGFNGEGDGSIQLKDNLENSSDYSLAKKLKSNGKIVVSYIEILSKNHEQLAVKVGKIVDYIILVGKDWTVIPLENIIADLQKENVKIIAAVNNVDDAQLALETLEIGVDGIIFEPEDFNQIKKMAKLIENLSSSNYQLFNASVTKIEGLISGDRVCIDTASMLNVGEGMLIGSYSKGMFLVHSETLESEYVASRPFRVNAGPVQAYVMGLNNKTKYLSEVETGDELLAVDQSGKTRPVLVGRVKIEKRPLILVEAEYNGYKIKTLLQNAETIRLVSDKGEAISVSNLKIGDKVKVYIDKSARHFGMAIEETIIEK
ncbi:3-dehydroquinate synthase II [Methanobrevibacter curvatus]|uniref:3-dehydroquinate synthase n=1 Tax=Methanobrevibacter curvatus TaxID=49547 RepID=A0A166CII6_9EURY|nr:3-dehydroquinate synthase II [Methanobrevibacter curvatus]KZX14544.1 3-amino-4-hydroxybenzoic acid synthase [Methanobrevibacter curvatus]